MDYIDEDTDLLRALEISRLEEEARQRRITGSRSTTTKPEPEYIEILDSDSDTEEEEAVKIKPAPSRPTAKRRNTSSKDAEAQFQADLARALAISQPSTSKTTPLFRSPSIDDDGDHSPPGPTLASTPNLPVTEKKPNGFLSERAQMEAERLARLKRLRPDAEIDDERPAKRTSASASSSGSSRRPSPDRQGKGKGKSTVEENRYWKGELRSIANQFAEPGKDTKPTFKLSQIIDKDSASDKIEFLVVSSYCTQDDWLAKLLPKDVPIIMIAQPGPDGNTSTRYHPTYHNWVRTTPFLPNGRGCMHMKFMLIFYTSGRLRLMISTANMVDYDWQMIENMAWVQDFPLRSSPIPHDPKAADFPATLQRVLRKLNFQPALRSHLNGDYPSLPITSIDELRQNWDFSQATVALIASIAGKHEGWPQVIGVGFTQLMKAVRDTGAACPVDQDLMMECQGSSIGTYSSKWLNDFYDSVKGISPDTWLDAPRGRRAGLPTPSNVKILFPSLNTVDGSALGRPGGGTMFCQEKQWHGANFPRHLFHDSKSKRGRTLMHTKMIVSVFRSKPQVLASSSVKKKIKANVEDLDPNVGGWCYVGSHNFTPSAWGNLSGTSFTPIMNIANYELGIFFTLPKENVENAANDVACFVRPPPAYRRSDVPWMQNTHGTQQS